MSKSTAMAISGSPKRWLLTLLGILFVGYILFQARFLILGPQVWIEAPRDGEVLASPVVTISGRATNAAWISLNDSQIFTDEEGHWSEKLIAPHGTSIMTVRVRDRFGREEEQSITIIFN